MTDSRLRSRRASALAAAALLVLTVAGCGGADDAKPATGDDRANVADGSPPTSSDDPDDSGETEGNPSTDLPSDEDIEAYFEAFADREPDPLNEALDLTEPGSVAEAFLLYTISVVDAVFAAGYSVEDVAATDFDEIDGGWRVCNGEEDDDCYDYTEIEGRDGKIVNFLANGEQLNDRLTVGSGEPVPAGEFGTVTLRAAYHNKDKSQLNVIVDVTSGDEPIDVADYNSTYRGADGRQYTAGDDSFGGDELGPNSTTTVALAFPNAAFGGEVTVELQNESYDEATATLPIN